jgi:hypothetical protein
MRTCRDKSPFIASLPAPFFTYMTKKINSKYLCRQYRRWVDVNIAWTDCGRDKFEVVSSSINIYGGFDTGLAGASVSPTIEFLLSTNMLI